jgi:tetratricopeptide (TPR) repeat protein
LALLEARRDPVRLKEHYFWLMWLYYSNGQSARCVDACNRGMELAELLGTAPVQYASIKALALTELGRFDEVEAALAQEVTDDDHPFGQLVAQLARVVFLDRVGALPEAIATAIEAHRRAVELSRPLFQRWLLGLLSSMGGRLIAEGIPVPSSLTQTIEDGLPTPRRAVGEWQLRNGNPAAAVVLLEPEVAHMQERGDVREQTLAQLILAETYLDLGRPGDAVLVAEGGLALAIECGQASLTWQYRLALARAYDALGRTADATHERQTAASEIDTLAARIADPQLRAAMESQPRLRRWTRAPEHGDGAS